MTANVWILGGYQSDFARNLTREDHDFADLTREVVDQTLAAGNYLLHTAEDAAAVLTFRSTFSEPTIAERHDAVRVAFTAGASSWASVPYSQRQAVLFLAAHLYEVRTPINIGNIVNDIPMTLTSLITMNRIGGFIG